MLIKMEGANAGTEEMQQPRTGSMQWQIDVKGNKPRIYASAFFHVQDACKIKHHGHISAKMAQDAIILNSRDGVPITEAEASDIMGYASKKAGGNALGGFYAISEMVPMPVKEVSATPAEALTSDAGEPAAVPLADGQKKVTSPKPEVLTLVSLRKELDGVNSVINRKHDEVLQKLEAERHIAIANAEKAAVEEEEAARKTARIEIKKLKKKLEEKLNGLRELEENYGKLRKIADSAKFHRELAIRSANAAALLGLSPIAAARHGISRGLLFALGGPHSEVCDISAKLIYTLTAYRLGYEESKTIMSMQLYETKEPLTRSLFGLFVEAHPQGFELKPTGLEGRAWSEEFTRAGSEMFEATYEKISSKEGDKTADMLVWLFIKKDNEVREERKAAQEAFLAERKKLEEKRDTAVSAAREKRDKAAREVECVFEEKKRQISKLIQEAACGELERRADLLRSIDEQSELVNERKSRSS